MSTSNKGVNSFKGYKVKHVEIRLNEEYDESEVTIDMQIGANISVDNDTQDMTVDLNLDIFKDANSNKYPFEMTVCISGLFRFEGAMDEKVDRYQANALAILFPYARALISTYTAN